MREAISERPLLIVSVAVKDTGSLKNSFQVAFFHRLTEEGLMLVSETGVGSEFHKLFLQKNYLMSLCACVLDRHCMSILKRHVYFFCSVGPNKEKKGYFSMTDPCHTEHPGITISKSSMLVIR